MKLRWTNGHSFAIEFEANDPASFYRNAMMHLDLFRAARAKRVHRGEIHINVIRCEMAELGVYSPNMNAWYNPEGEGRALDTRSFGHIVINRHFTVRAKNIEHPADDPLYQRYSITLISDNPLRAEDLDLTSTADSGRIWNLCIGAVNHETVIHQSIDGFMQDLEKYTDGK